jgi:phenylacetate-CoA ligase
LLQTRLPAEKSLSCGIRFAKRRLREEPISRLPDAPDVPPALAAGELRDLQLERLKETLRRAFERVPYYRRAFDEAGVRPDHVGALEDVARFPFTTKDALRESYPFGMFAVAREEIARLHVSSGTTGTPTVVGYSAADLDTWASIMARSLAAVGGRAGDIVHNAFGYGLFTGGLGWHGGAERLGATVLPVSGGATERQVQLLRELRPTILLATPTYMLVIADEMERQGIEAKQIALRLAIFGAEPASESLRTEIEARLGVTAFDSYGLSEVMGPGVAQETPSSRGALTLWEDHFLAEIVDPASGAVLPEGQTGELVLTTLSKEAMPIVRYRTRDLTQILPAREEGGMRRIARINGRADDMLIIRGVNLFPTQIEALIAGDRRLAPHYLIELSRPNRLDELLIRIELRPKRWMSEEEQQSVAEATERRIKDRLGISAAVVIEAPGTLERVAGKAKRVRDLRPKE